MGPLAKPYLEDSEEEQLFIEASKTTESQEQLFVEASKTTESQEQLFVEASKTTESQEQLFVEASKTTENQEQQEPRKFGLPVGQEYLKSLRDRAIPQSTCNQTKWAVQRWRDWVTDRNRHGLSCDEGIAPYDLENQEYEVIAYWMERFICEARKKDSGQDYPPDTLYALVVSLQRHVRTAGKRPELDFFKQPEFDDMKRTLDAKMKELTEKGVDTEKRKAQVITEEMEDYLWESKLLGDHSPQALLDTIVFCNGIYFALRSGKEHRQLRAKPCQISVVEELEQRPYLLYRESSSKNKPAGLKGRNRPKKEVIQHANLENSACCPVRLFKVYQSLCPKDRPDAPFKCLQHRTLQPCNSAVGSSGKGIKKTTYVQVFHPN